MGNGDKYCSIECYNNSNKNKRIEKKCPSCGKLFHATTSRINHGGGKYCSKKCKYKALNKKIKRMCKVCGKEFSTSKYRVEHGGGKFCSKKCRGESRNGEDHPNWKGGKVKRICKECGKEFYVLACYVKRNQGKYCSIECSSKARSKNQRGENSPNWKGGLIEHVCLSCGKKFYIAPSRLKNKNDGLYCSNKCYGKSVSGENSSNWTGGPKEYCIKFNKDLKNRIIAFWYEYNKNICPLCEKPFDDKTPHCHHAYYDKKACCLISTDGIYYSNLGIKGDEKIFEIIGDPNKFAPLHNDCHTKTNNKKKREFYARKFETIINEKFNGKSYFTKEEYKEFLIRHPEWISPYK